MSYGDHVELGYWIHAYAYDTPKLYNTENMGMIIKQMANMHRNKHILLKGHSRVLAQVAMNYSNP